MYENDGCGTIIAIMIVGVITFLIGLVVATSSVQNDNHREICQKLSITAEDYINCNAEKFSETILRIPKVNR